MRVRVAIIGSGPTGLIAASLLSVDPRFEIDLYERRSGFGRKLLVAGSSGLNISHHLPPDTFAAQYLGSSPEFWKSLLKDFGREDWIHFLENDLGMETFLGTSDRYFVKEMKASNLLTRWKKKLEASKVSFHTNSELTDFETLKNPSAGRLEFKLRFGEAYATFDKVIFALGGGSWENAPPIWPTLFRRKGFQVHPFEPANTGYSVEWKEAFLKEAEGKPLKKIRFGNQNGEKLGELVVTHYGLEGTPVYFLGTSGPAWIDLKPDLTEAAIRARLESVRENLAPIRRVKKNLELCEAAQALLFHHLSETERKDLPTLVARIKKFPLTLGLPRPLSESISSRGGLDFESVAPTLELRDLPGAYAGGEMLDWHAPTGGFLIQATVSMGARIAASLRAKADAS